MDLCHYLYSFYVSTHSRPKAAGYMAKASDWRLDVFQHTAARRRLEARFGSLTAALPFQHTAARRRLATCRALLDS